MLKQFFKRNWILIGIWMIITLTIILGTYFGLDKKLIALGIIIFSIFAQAFSFIVNAIGLIPVVGPFIVKIVTLPAIWITNALAYIITFLALHKGAKLDILKSRVLVVAFITGVVIGFILAKLL
ncbi:MAG: hypothetical protein HY769_00220 [Candidatus Stahlbacteria bacterium]|nr:hypothetical protein [Candidatus Stahlbacteria bacterium]